MFYACAGEDTETETETTTETVYVENPYKPEPVPDPIIPEPESPNYIVLSDKVEKGPCNKDSEVLAFPLHNGFYQTGDHFLGGTKTDLGYWEVPAQISEEYEYTDAKFNGLCFNERYSGQSHQSLRAIFGTFSEYRSINPLTTIAVDVIREISKNQEVRDDAQAIIDAELLVSNVFGFGLMDPFSSILLNNGDENAAKLAVASAAILQARSDQSDFMIEISQAIINGNTDAVVLELSNNMSILPIFQVHKNLKGKYESLNALWNYPPMHTVLGLSDYYGDLINRDPVVQISHNMELTGSLSFDQNTFNTFAVPIIFENEILTSNYIAFNFPPDSQISIWTKSADAYPVPDTKLQDITALREILLKPMMSYNGMLDSDNMPTPGVEYYIVIRKDTDFVLSKNGSGPALPFGQVLASDDEMVSYIGLNVTAFFTRDFKYFTTN
jgi:hypothetical protein